MDILIPSWFFGLDSIFYIIAALIGFLVSFLAYKAFSYTKVQNHFYLYISFAALGMGFLILGLINIYGYLVITESGGNLNNYLFRDYASFRDVAIWLYHLTGLFSA